VVAGDFDTITGTDPSHADESVGFPVTRAAYDTLVTVAPSNPGTILPSLARAWTVSPDASEFTFKMRPGVKFVTGHTMGAADVAWSFNRLRYVKGLPGYLADGIDSIETSDPMTVTIKLKHPDSSFLGALTSLSFAVFDSQFLAGKGGTDTRDASTTDKAQAWLDGNSAGTGPYVITEWTRKTQITLKRFPGSWRSAAFDQVLFRYVPNSQVAKLMLQRGDADLAVTLVTRQIEELRGDKNIKIATAPALGLMLLHLNRNPALNGALPDPRVDAAVRYAIDYAGIRQLAPGAVTPPSVVPVGLRGALPPEDAVVTDVAKAKALLTEAGYPNGFSVQLTYPATRIYFGVPFSIVAAKLQSDLAAVGIRVTLDPLADPVFIQKYRSGKAQIALATWTADYADAGDFVPPYVPGGIQATRMGWTTQNTQVAALSAKALSTADPATRATLYQQTQRLLLAAGPWAVLLQPVIPIAYRAALSGVAVTPTWLYDVAAVRTT
jgi:peptide/nickel transport system substrate-binding protein